MAAVCLILVKISHLEIRKTVITLFFIRFSWNCHWNVCFPLLFQNMTIKILQSAPISKGPLGNWKQDYFLGLKLHYPYPFHNNPGKRSLSQGKGKPTLCVFSKRLTVFSEPSMCSLGLEASSCPHQSLIRLQTVWICRLIRVFAVPMNHFVGFTKPFSIYTNDFDALKNPNWASL